MFRTCKDTFRIPVSKESANTSNSDHNTPKKEYFCEFCSVDSEYKVWNLETDLEIHRRQFHKKEILHLLADPKNFMCTVCLHKQSDKTTLIQHIKSHHLLSPPNATRVKREVFICDYCNRLFFNKQLLSVHIEALHLLSDSQKKKATTKCPSCNLEVTIKSIWFHFLAHGIIHTTTCPICVRTFESTHEILEHIETHPGYYNCCICVYQSKKERHFLNHIDIHKKTVDVNTKSVQNILKYFIPQRKSVSWTKKFLNIFKGITLASEVKICILCQTMCVTDEEMLQHIHGDHSPSVVTEVKKYLCLCGEEFFNNILLKHHVFTLKGHHKAFNGTKEELDRLNRETDSPLVIDMETEVMDTDTLNNVQINNKNEEENNDTSNIETSNIDTSNIDTSNIDTSNIDTSNIDTSNIDTSNIDTSNIDTSNIEIYEIHEDVESIDDDENSRAHTLETMEGDSDPVDRDTDTVEVDQDDRIISEKERIEDVVGSEEYDKLIIINNTFKESENSEENSEDTENIVYRVLEVPAEVEFRQETEKVIDEHSIRFHQD